MSDVFMRIMLSANSGSSIGVIQSVSSALGSGGLAGTLLTVGVAAAGLAVGIGVKAVQAASTFQDSMTSLVTGAGEAESRIGMVSDGILTMAVATGTSTAQLSTGMYQIESAGYHGAAGLTVLKAAAEGAKVGNADLGTVANATTTIMTDFSSKNVTASQAVNTLVATVSNGKTTMQELSASLSQVLPTASAAGVSLTDTAAAMATMTGEGVPAAQAATYLRQTIIGIEAPSSQAGKALKSIGLTTSQVSDEMKKSLPGALAMITDAVGKKFPVGSAAYVNAIKEISGGSKTMQGMLDLTGAHMATFNANVKNVSSAVNSGGSSINGWNLVQKDFSFTMSQASEVVQTLMIRIGQQLLPTVTKLAQSVLPVISNFSDWLLKSGALQNGINALTNGIASVASKGASIISFFQHSAAATTGLKVAVMAIAGPVIATLVFGLYSWATAAGAAALASLALAWPVLAVGLAIGLLVGGFILLYNHVTPFRMAIQAVAQFISSNFLPVMRAIGAFLTSTFAPVWQQIVQVFNSQLVPAFNQFLSAMRPILPQLEMLGKIIAGVVVVALVILVSIIAGVIVGFANMLPGIVRVFTGIVQYISGAIQVISGIIAFFVDLCSGHFNKLGADLGVIWQGIVTMFKGVWNIISGLFSAAVGLVGGIVVGFCTTIKNIFVGLYNDLVGHSIIPDMINGIINFFSQLPGRVIAFVVSLISQAVALFTAFSAAATMIAGQIVSGIANQIGQLWARASGGIQSFISSAQGLLNGFVSTCENIGSNMVNGIANGINGAISSVTGAIKNVTDAIASFLPKSPAKRGELSHLNEYGPALVGGFATGIVQSLPLMLNAMNQLTAPMGAAINVPITSSTTAGASASALLPSSIASASRSGSGGASGGGNTVVIQQLTPQLIINSGSAPLTPAQVQTLIAQAMPQLSIQMGDALRAQMGNV